MPPIERCAADTIPDNAVVLHVWKANGRTVADVLCCSGVATEHLVADFPRPVPLALQRAKELCDACGLHRIAVVVPDENLWNPAWGKLILH